MSASESATNNCCTDCGNGRTACDELCIRATALAECRQSCFSNSDAASKLVKHDWIQPKRRHGFTNLEEDHCPKTPATGSAKCNNKKSTCGMNADDDRCNSTKCGGCCATDRSSQCVNDKRDSCDGVEANDCRNIDNPDPKARKTQDICHAAKNDDRCTGDDDDAHLTIADDCNASVAKKRSTSARKSCGSKAKQRCNAQDSSRAALNNIKSKETCCEDDEGNCVVSRETYDSTMSTSETVLPTEEQACEGHLQQAFTKYASYLDKGICICRTVLDRLDGCCGPPAHKNSADTTAMSDISNERSSSVATSSMAGLRRNTKAFYQKSCCGTPVSTLAKFSEANTSSPEISIVKHPKLAKPSKLRVVPADIESDAAREHVVLQVSGMTCTGCATKLSNVLSNISGVFSPKVTFVTGTTEFDLDQNIERLERVMPRLGKETGFTFSQILSDQQILHLVIDPALVCDALPHLDYLCESVDRVNHTTCRISYNPAAIGARSIMSCAPGIKLAPPASDAKLAAGRDRLIRMLWSTSAAAALTIPIVTLAWSKTSASYTAKSVAELVLATGVQAIAIPEFYVGAMKALVYSRVLEMDMLVVISITAAYVYSVVAFALTYAGYVLEEGAFFETSSLLITLVLLGRLVAASAKVQAISAVSVQSLQVERANLFDSLTEESMEIDARLLQYGDVFVVSPHASIVTDGSVVHGSSLVDESMVTGESLPVVKHVGAQVTAGTINGDGTLRISLTRVPGMNSITDIAKMVEKALASKPRIQDLADRVAGYFVPAVVTISLVVFAVWIVVALKVRNKDGGGTVGLALTYGIAVLAVSCPCALGLAVPMVLVITGGVAARLGIIIKHADAIEQAHKVTDVVFDKTGTITTGELGLIEQQIFPDAVLTRNEVLSIIMAVTKDNHHPISLSISSELMKLKIKPSGEVDDVESVPGAGIRCRWKGRDVVVGSPFWLAVDHCPEVAALLDQGQSVFCILIASRLVAVLGLKSTIREEARGVIADLHHRGITCHVVSGDAPKAVEDVAQSVGIPAGNIVSRQRPAEKQEYVEKLMAAKRVVLFCGDGTNDAVAIAQAHVGVQIGVASDVTRAAADVVLLGGLEGLTSLLDLSKQSFHRIVFNFVWSATYNVLAILLACGAFVKFRSPPAYAGLGEIVSVMPVIIIALTLLKRKRIENPALRSMPGMHAI